MKTRLLFFTVFVFAIKGYSQEMPKIIADKKELQIKKLKVETHVIHNMAFTLYEMDFYNPHNRVLEGELSFPLADDQSVIRFGLDINGKIRDAVVVESERARVAYETTISRKIDPALLEKTKGNNYKARVYPIPPRGYKKVVIGYQQSLSSKNKNYEYKLPFSFENKLNEFSFELFLFDSNEKPNVSFDKKVNIFKSNQDYRISYNQKNNSLNQDLIVSIPESYEATILSYEDYSYLHKKVKLSDEKKSLPNSITLFWDASLSRQNSDLEKEIEFLDTYFKNNKNINVRFVTFGLEIYKEDVFKIENGKWNSLKSTIESIKYDGATRFNFLESYSDNSEEYFLFTDGMNTLDKHYFSETKKPIHVINSSSSSNPSFLKEIAFQSKSNYINLKTLTIDKAVQMSLGVPLVIMGSSLPENYEFYPPKNSQIRNEISVAVKGNINSLQQVKFYLGKNQDTIQEVVFDINKPTGSQYLPKIWAQKKLWFLERKGDEFLQDIVDVSKEYQIVSPYTSMIVLDRIQDYVTYEIEPPAELLDQYKRLMARKIDNKKQRVLTLKKNLLNGYEHLFSWYDKNDKIKKEQLSQNTITSERITNLDSTETISSSIAIGNLIIKGTIRDNMGGLPGVSILVEGSTNAVNSDFDGNYSINAKVGDVLRFSYLGYETQKITITNSNRINVKLREGGEILDEIVVTSYGRSLNSPRSASSLSRVDSKTLENIPISTIDQILQGTAAGVYVATGSGQPGQSGTIIIRGLSSLKGDIEPLFVIDGVPVAQNNFRSLNPSEIESIQVLKDAAATSVYGNRAAGGVVIVKTKSRRTFNRDLISEKREKFILKDQKFRFNPKDGVEKAYDYYLRLRPENKHNVDFYLTVSDYFFNNGFKKIGLRVLSNLAETHFDNANIYKTLAYKLEEQEEYDYAKLSYQEILKLRPEDIQSYRDMANIYEEVGEYQKALELFYFIVNGSLAEKDMNRRFQDIESISLVEMNRIIKKYSNKLDTSIIDKKYIKELSVDLRVVIDWNHDHTDVDLWVIDPTNEKCDYSNQETKIGGRISSDMTDGYGPEEFLLKDALQGKYKIKVQYFGSTRQRVSSSGFVKLTTFKNYGKENEIKVVKLVKIEKVDDTIDLGHVVI